MKRSVIVAALAVAAAAAAPAVTGWVVERGSDERLAAATDEIPLLSVHSHTYRRGWFSSEETITFEFLKGMKLPAAIGPAPADGATPLPRPPYLLTIHNAIQHGPLPGLSSIGLARVESTLAFATAGATPATLPKGQSRPMIETVFGLFGGGRTTISSKAYVDVGLAEHAHVTADPTELVIDFGRHLDRFDVEWTAPHVLVSDDDGSRLELSGFHVAAHEHRVLRTLYGGNAELTIGALELSGIPAKDGPTGMGLKVVHMTSQADGVGDFMNSSVTLSIRAAEVGGTTVQGIKFDGGGEHWQLDAFERLAAGSRAATRDHATDAAAQAAAILKVWQSAGVALVTRDPVFTIRDLEFLAPDGSAKLSGSFGIKGATESDFKVPLDARLLVPKLAVDFDITVDEDLVTAYQAQTARKAQAQAEAATPTPRAGAKQRPASVPPDPLQPMIAQGFVTRERGKLHTRIVFAKGVLTVNGKPFPGTPPTAEQ